VGGDKVKGLEEEDKATDDPSNFSNYPISKKTVEILNKRGIVKLFPI